MFIDSVIWIARVTKIPDLIIGATLVSIGTTLPEVMVSVSSTIQGNTEIALGNALGSIACNTGLILAITIILSRPKLKEKMEFQQKGILLVLLIILIYTIGLIFGEISRTTGVILLGILVWYLFRNVHKCLQNNNTNQPKNYKTTTPDKKIIVVNLSIFIIGLALTIWGACILVTNGEKIAVLMEIPDIVIGLTMTAFGTSLPELMTAITALRKKAHGISMGNVLGANILNIILVIGLSATILPIPISPNVLHLHLPFIFLIVSATVLFSFTTKNYFHRHFGFILFSAYIIYILLTISS